jgi:hypothetical protein
MERLTEMNVVTEARKGFEKHGPRLLQLAGSLRENNPFNGADDGNNLVIHLIINNILRVLPLQSYNSLLNLT